MDFGLELRRKVVALVDADVEIEVVMYPSGGGGAAGGGGGSNSSASAAKLLRLPLLATELSE